MKTKLSLLLASLSMLMVGCDTTDECDDKKASEEVVTSNGAEDFKRAVGAGDRVYFRFDKSDITTDARAVLEKQAAWLKGNTGAAVTVEGHCDSRGTREYNLALGEHRANSAKDALVGAGVAADRVQTISYGKDKPPVEGHDREARAKQRTAITVVS